GPPLDAAPSGDDAVELAHLVGAESHGQAQLPEIATRTGDFDAVSVHVFLRNSWPSLTESPGSVEKARDVCRAAPASGAGSKLRVFPQRCCDLMKIKGWVVCFMHSALQYWRVL